MFCQSQKNHFIFQLLLRLPPPQNSGLNPPPATAIITLDPHLPLSLKSLTVVGPGRWPIRSVSNGREQTSFRTTRVNRSIELDRRVVIESALHRFFLLIFLSTHLPFLLIDEMVGKSKSNVTTNQSNQSVRTTRKSDKPPKNHPTRAALNNNQKTSEIGAQPIDRFIGDDSSSDISFDIPWKPPNNSTERHQRCHSLTTRQKSTECGS